MGNGQDGPILAARWVCECGKKIAQPEGPEAKVIRKCECGKELYKLLEPDGIITEYIKAEIWFVEEFDKQSAKIATAGKTFNQEAFQFITLLKKSFESLDRVSQTQKQMHNIVNHGARRHRDKQNVGLLKRKDMMWNFNRAIQMWMGRLKPKGGVK